LPAKNNYGIYGFTGGSMTRGSETTQFDFQQPDYSYGNRSAIEVIRLVPAIGKSAIDPHASLDHQNLERPSFTEAQLKEKVTEVADNYQIIADPKSAEKSAKQFGVTIANRDLLERGEPAILIISTAGSSLYDEKGNPNNEGNVLEMAYTAFKYKQPIVYGEGFGSGNSVDFEAEEYKQAAKDGKLVHEVRDHTGRITSYEAFQSLSALARALEHAGINISHLSSNASGAHLSSGMMAALPESSLTRAFLYNPTNVSDRTVIGLGAANIWEAIFKQGSYSKASKDPLQLTDERKQMAREVMASVKKRKFDQARARTHNPVKLWRQQKIFSRGNQNGQSAAVHSVVGQMRHPDMRQTVIFPEFAAQYKSPRDFEDYIRIVVRLGGTVIRQEDLESLKIPIGQYGHSHYPTVRQTLESYAFNR
jgi:hypothetical protein